MLRLDRGDTVQLQVQYVCSIAIVRAIQWPRRDFKVTNHTHPLPTLTLTIHSSWTAAFQSLCPPSPSGLEFAYFSTKHCILLNLFLVSLPPSLLPTFLFWDRASLHSYDCPGNHHRPLPFNHRWEDGATSPTLGLSSLKTITNQNPSKGHGLQPLTVYLICIFYLVGYSFCVFFCSLDCDAQTPRELFPKVLSLCACKQKTCWGPYKGYFTVLGLLPPGGRKAVFFVFPLESVWWGCRIPLMTIIKSSVQQEWQGQSSCLFVGCSVSPSTHVRVTQVQLQIFSLYLPVSKMFLVCSQLPG